VPVRTTAALAAARRSRWTLMLVLHVTGVALRQA
jgi:hypothetical protein